MVKEIFRNVHEPQKISVRESPKGTLLRISVVKLNKEEINVLETKIYKEV